MDQITLRKLNYFATFFLADFILDLFRSIQRKLGTRTINNIGLAYYS